MTTIDFNALMQEAKAAGTAVLPNGEYTVTVTETEATTASTGRPMIKLSLQVNAGSQHTGRKIRTQIVLTEDNPKALRMFFRNLRTFGIDDATVLGLSNVDNGLGHLASMLVGRAVVVKVSSREWPEGSGEYNNQVDAYKSLGGAAPVVGASPVASPIPGAPSPFPAPQAAAPIPGAPQFPTVAPTFAPQPAVAPQPGLGGPPPGQTVPPVPGPAHPTSVPPVASVPPAPVAAVAAPAPASAPDDAPVPGYEALWPVLTPEQKALVRQQFAGPATQPAAPAPAAASAVAAAPAPALPPMPQLPFGIPSPAPQA